MCNIRTNTGEMLLINMRLKKFESENQQEYFIRINNQVIININYIEHFQPAPNARLEVTLKNSIVYYVNRYFIKLFKEKLL